MSNLDFITEMLSAQVENTLNDNLFLLVSLWQLRKKAATHPSSVTISIPSMLSFLQEKSP
jgi:hypothetical protein